MVFLINGKLVDVVRMWRVEVESKREVEAVKEYAETHNREFKTGKVYGKPGERRMDCYMEADHYDLREKVRDTLSRILGHDVRVYIEMETIAC